MSHHPLLCPALPAAIRRRVATGTVTALTLLGLLAAGIPAASADATPSPAPSDSGDHAMGSTIRLHETIPNLTPAPDATVTPFAAPAGVPGMDVSGWQGNVDWKTAAANGAKFAYIKATEGTGFTSAYFGSQYAGSYTAGLIRGAYHFARPDISDGNTQANFFVNHGGGWSPDGRTLPPLLDIEYNPYGATCYGLTQPAMVQWIKDFSATIQARTGRAPAIYTTTNWWTTCTGNSAGFADKPLFIAAYSSWVGPMPASWGTYSFWQHAAAGLFPGDQDVFNGSLAQLATFARGSVPQVFADVSAANQFFTQINWMMSARISTGYPDGTYRPLNTVNRDAMAAFLYRFAGSPAYTPPAKSPFKDVAPTSQFYKEICWLAALKIATGYPDGTFRPGQQIDRDAMAAFIYRAQGSPAYNPPAKSPFKDVAPTSPFYREIDWLAAKGISTGFPDGTFRPLDSVNRDAMAAFLYRLRNQ